MTAPEDRRDQGPGPAEDRGGPLEPRRPADFDWRAWIRDRLFSQVPCPIAVVGRDYLIKENNSAFVEIFGDGRGKHCYETWKRRTEPCRVCAVRQAFGDGLSHVNDEQGVDRYGCDAFFILNAQPVISDSGDIPCVMAISTDVTEITRRQQEYRRFFEQVPCLVWVLNKDLRVVRSNENFRRSFGDPGGRHCYEIMRNRSEPCETCPALTTFEDGENHQVRHACFPPNGEEWHYFVNASPLSEDDRNRGYVVMTANDVTEEEELREDLAEAAIFREVMIENSIDAIVWTDSSGRITMINPAAEELFGYKAREVIMAKPPGGMFPPEFDRAVAKKEERCLLDEATIRDAGGEEIPVRFAGVAVRRAGNFLGYAVFILDLRRIKELERRMVTAEKRATAGKTVAGLAHTIKNILVGLEGGVYLFKTGREKEQKKRMDDGWNMIEKNLGLVQSITRQLLNFAREKETTVTMVDPRALARQVLELYQVVACEEGVELVGAPAPEIAPMPCDEGDLHTAITNLVSNAVDACRDCGKEECRVTLACSEKDGAVVFTISDQGPGMPEEQRAKAFDHPFTTKGKEGTGLGLMLTAKIVHDHGGHIELESEPGLGTTIELVFPRDKLPELPEQAVQGAREQGKE